MGSDRTSGNYVTSLTAKSNAGDGADVILWADPSTHRLLVSASGGAGGGTSFVDDAAFTVAVDSGTPMMGIVTADSVDSGDAGVVAMTTTRALHVFIKGSDVATGGTSMVDDAAFTPGTTSITPMGAMFDDVAPDSVNEGDGGVVRMSANRNLYVTLRDAAGNERGLNIAADGSLAITVATIPSHAVTNAGTFVVQENGAALTALQLIDDTVFTAGTSTYTEATSKGNLLLGVRRDADTTLVDTTNEMAPLQVNAAGQLKVALITALPAGTNGIGKLTANSGVTIGAVEIAAAQTLATVTTVTTVTTLTGTTSLTPGTAAANLGKAEDAAHTTGDVGVMALGVRSDAGATGNPTALATTSLDYIPLATDANNRLYVNVAGDLAHDAADSTSNPVKIGGQARTTNPTAVADADRSNLITDKLGKLVVVGSIRDLKVNQITTITASTSETTVLTAVASTFLDVYGVIVVNSSATVANVSFKDSTAGTTRFNVYVPAGDTRGFMLGESAAIAQTTVNNNWTATSSASVSSLIITMLAVKNI